MKREKAAVGGKETNALIAASLLLYMSTICIKILYSAEAVMLLSALSETKARVGFGLTLYYLCYAILQIVLYIVMPRLRMKPYLTVTLALSAVGFALVPFCGALWQIWVLMGLMGFLQAGTVGGLMHFLGLYVPKERMGAVCRYMAAGLALGTAFAYVLGSLFVFLGAWRLSFVLMAAVHFPLLAWLWRLLSREERREARADAADASGVGTPDSFTPADAAPSAPPTVAPRGIRLPRALLLCALLACIFSIAYYGLSGWFPTLLKESFGFQDAYSVLLSALLPLVSAVGPVACFALCDRRGRAHFQTGLWLYLPAVLLSLLMLLLYRLNGILTLVMAVLLILFVKGVSGIYATYIPAHSKDKAAIGRSVALINAFSALGASVAPTLAGSIIDKGGYDGLFLLMLALALLTLLLSALGAWTERDK